MEKAAGVLVSQDNKSIARYIDKCFINPSRIIAYHSDDRSFSIGIATSVDTPTTGICSSSTLGLSDVQLYRPDGRLFDDFRIELVSAYHANFEYVKNVLFYLSYYIKTEKWLCHYGLFFEDLLLKFGCKGSVRHIYFETPFIWDGMEGLKLQEKNVIWVYAIPVTSEEKSFIQSRSFEELDEIWDKKNTDIFDLGRPSAV